MTVLEQVAIAGDHTGVYRIVIENGIFTSIEKMTQKGAPKAWIAPGLMDLHLHLGWTDFFREVQNERSREDIQKRIGDSLEKLCSFGIMGVRDVGGSSPEFLLGAAKGQEQIPALALCAGVYGDATPISERGDWVKIFATGGVGAAKEDVLLPTMSEEAFQSAIRKIHEMGKKAAIHTWGGKSLDWSIEAGADSVEHCVYMTEEQAERLAEKQITYVPTARIYQLIADPHSYLALPEAFVEHAKAACQGHQKAVWYGKKKGVIMAFGTDFYSDPRLLEQELEEIFALADYGLSMEEIWKAGTENAALALGLENSHGKIAVGYVADAVLYDKDPYQAENGDALKAFIRKIF